METQKYAFIMNSEALTPDTYFGTLDTEGLAASFFGVHSIHMAKDTAKRLAEEGYGRIDLCGDFNVNAGEAVRIAVGGKARVSVMKYFPEEQEKLEGSSSLAKYGIIVMGAGFAGKPGRLVMPSDEFTATICGAGSAEEAMEAAEALVAEGIDFIELSSDFDAELARKIILRIAGKIAVGFAGNAE